jgi:P pilus assembly chaperone PapD
MNPMNCKIGIPPLLSVFVFVVFGTISGRAQISIGVTPIRAEHQLIAGQLKTDRLTVENMSEKPVHVRLTVADWYLTKDGEPIFVKRGKASEKSMSDWLEVNPTEFNLAENGRQPIRYTLEVPDGTSAGGYRTAIMVETIPEFAQGREANVAYLSARIGVILYGRVGTVPTRAEIVDQRIVPDPQNTGKMAVQLTIANKGLAHFRIKGDCSLLDNSNQVAQTIPLPDVVFLPESERSILLKLEKQPPSDGFTILSRVDVGLNELLEASTRVSLSR